MASILFSPSLACLGNRLGPRGSFQPGTVRDPAASGKDRGLAGGRSPGPQEQDVSLSSLSPPPQPALGPCSWSRIPPASSPSIISRPGDQLQDVWGWEGAQGLPRAVSCVW